MPAEIKRFKVTGNPAREQGLSHIQRNWNQEGFWNNFKTKPAFLVPLLSSFADIWSAMARVDQTKETDLGRVGAAHLLTRFAVCGQCAVIGDAERGSIRN